MIDTTFPEICSSYETENSSFLDLSYDLEHKFILEKLPKKTKASLNLFSEIFLNFMKEQRTLNPLQKRRSFTTNTAFCDFSFLLQVISQ